MSTGEPEQGAGEGEARFSRSPSNETPGGVEPGTESEWAVRIAGEVSWSRILVVGTWMVVAASALIWAEGPFWRDGMAWFRQAQDAAVRGDWARALANVERAREAEPEHGGLATFEGYARLRTDDPEGATEAFREARAQAPGDVEPLLGLAEASLETADTAAARAALEDAASLPASAPDRVRLSGLAEAAGDPALALDILMEAPSRGTLSDRIRLAFRLERWDLSARLLRESLAEDPSGDRIEERRLLARALQQGGRSGEALSVYEGLAASGDLDREAAVGYAWLLNEERRHSEALEVLARVGEPGGEVTELRIRTALWANRLDEAEERLSRALSEDPGDPELVGLREELERTRRLRVAQREEARARAEAEARAREAATRERIARDTPPSEPAAALDFWMERLRQSPQDSVARGETVALLESFERFDEAARVLRAGRGIDEFEEPATLLHLARLAEWAERPDAVIRWLERYAALHDPVPDSARLMLARAYEAEGAEEDALRIYETLQEEGIGEALVSLAIARLRNARGDEAGATAAYERYLEHRPRDLQVRLELARHLASLGSLERSREQYRRYRSDGGQEPVALEVARVELGRARYEAAVEEAREAVEQEGSGQARFTLAEALRYSGERAEAEEVLEALARESADPTFRARVALLRDRPLEALDLLNGRSDLESRLLAARAAMDAGRWARAGRELEAASAAAGAADSRRLAPVQGRFRRGTASSVEGLVSGGSDDVDFSQVQVGAAAGGWIADRRARLRSSVESAFLSQGGLGREVLSVTVGADSLPVGDATFLAADAGLQLSDSDETTFSGTVRGLRRFEDGSSLGLEVDRAPIWEADNDFEPLRYSRVRNLSALGVGLMGTDLSVRARKSLGIGRAALFDAGLGWYSDGNRRSFVYGHVELPLETRVGRWISLQPNAYVEWFDQSVSSYASPSRYLATGVRALGIWEGDVGSLRLEANPHFFDYPGESGIGLSAEVEATRALGEGVEATIQGFYTGQGSVYDQYRASLGFRWMPGGG
ncbi:MAG: hypothetical protein R3223_06190 [Longimicrobiales bacterium]|nr:hypothetical protein [Longimicrobiales bacterium]